MSTKSASAGNEYCNYVITKPVVTCMDWLQCNTILGIHITACF